MRVSFSKQILTKTEVLPAATMQEEKLAHRMLTLNFVSMGTD